MFVAVTGPMCSGKKTLARYLVERHGFEPVVLLPSQEESCSAGGAQDGADETGSQPPGVQPATDRAPGEFGGLRCAPANVFSSFCALLDHVTARWQTNYVAWTLQDKGDLLRAKKRPFFLLVAVDAPVTMRYRRFTHRRLARTAGNNSGAGACSFEEFSRESDADMYGTPGSSKERTPIQANMLRSDLVIVNHHDHIGSFYRALDHVDVTNPERLRPSWDTYFMHLSDFAARRSNCMKRAVGCILVKDRRIISTGYNGTPRGVRNCGEGGCRRCNMNSRCGRSLDTCLCLHAEENALIEAGRTRLDDGQSILYCNTCPCLGCAKKIVQVGVSEVVYSQAYGMDDLTQELFEAAGVRFRKYRPLDSVMDNFGADGDFCLQYPLSRSPSWNGKLEVSGGKLQAFGSNAHGQLGVGRLGDLSLPAPCVFAAPESISLGRPPRLVTGGGNHTLLVTERGNVYVCGLNDTGQLGLAVKKKQPAGQACGTIPNGVRATNGDGQMPDDSVNDYLVFQPLPLPPCVAAACGWSHSLVVDNAGNVYSFGSAKHGQLGVNLDRPAEMPDWIDRPARVMFPGNVRISGVAAGRRHSVAVDAQGGVWAWGSARGALGLATPPPEGNDAERDNEEQCVAIKSTNVPRKVDVPAKIVRAACGANHTALLSEDGRVFTCGENRHGQLGYFTRAERTARLREAVLPAGSTGVDVVCGWSHTAVLLSDGRICAWGRGDKGQLGPVREGVSPFEPRIIEFRGGEGDRPVRVSAIAAGAEHTLCAFEDGRWAAWGWNEHGNCGTGDQVDVFEPAVTDAPAAVKAVGSGYGHSFVWSVGR